MKRIERQRAFIIRFVYYAIWIALIFALLKYGLPLFMPFVIAFVIAFVLKPLINFITEKTPLSRKAVSILVLIVVYAVLVTLIVLLGGKIVVFLSDWFGKLPAFYKNSIVPTFESASGFFDGFVERLDPDLLKFLNVASESLAQSISNIVSSISSSAVGMVTGVATKVPWFVVAFILTIIASFFLVADYYTVTSFITKQLPERAVHMLFTIKDYTVNVLFKFGRAYLILMSITFAEVFIGLLILGFKHAFPIAIITAIVDILPVFGTGTVLIPWAVFQLIAGEWFQGIGLLVLYLIITLVRQVIEPRIIGRQIGLYPLLTLICMFVGARLFGFWGMFGLPITLVVIIHLNRAGEIKLFKE